MIIRRLLLGPIGLATAAALVLATGTLAGGMAYEATHPDFDRLAWIERDPADAAGGDRAVRRVLFADGRFLALTDAGYRAGLLDPALVAEIFATAAAEAGGWADVYPAGMTGELVELELSGDTRRTISIANPNMNLGLPPTLTRLLTLIAAADRSVAAIDVAPAGLRFEARPVADAGGAPVEALPPGFPLEAAAAPGGTVVAGADLSLLASVWTDLGNRFAPGTAHRFVASGDRIWRIGWRLDLDSIGILPTTAEAVP